MILLVRTSGLMEGVYAEMMELNSVGELSIRRAGHVEPDDHGHWWVDLGALAGPRMGPFSRRSDAVAAEEAWLQQTLVSRPVSP